MATRISARRKAPDRRSFITRLCAGAITIVWLAGVAIQTPAKAFTPGKTGQLESHRAIYDMRLKNASAGSGVSGLQGRMVFEFSGSKCQGYTLNMRLVTRITDQEGKGTTTDLRSSTWEDGDGARFRFNSTQYHDQRLTEVTTGDAERPTVGKEIRVKLEKPASSELKLPARVLFPTQHSLAILAAARRGDNVLQAAVYDGSEKGKKLFQTTTFIGRGSLPSAPGSSPKGDNEKSFEHLRSWPVAISYFDAETSNSDDENAVPSYELSLRLYENGVSRKLLINYGEFSISGTLSSIDYLKVPACK